MRMIAHSYDSYDQAARAVQALESAGIPHDDISLVSGDKSRQSVSSAPGGVTETTSTGAGTGASLGTVLGGGAGLLAGLGMLAIPGIGPVVAAGWLIATVTGAGVGAAAGGLLGSLTGAGIDEADARGYTEHVGRGGTLVTVRASDAMAPEVEQILEGGPVGAGLASDAGLTTAPLSATGAVGGNTVPVERRPINRPLTGAGTQTGELRDNAATRAVDRTLDTNLSGENPTTRI